MWSIKLLSGPQTGQIFQLKEGDNFVGRSNDCDVVLRSTGISKKHAKIIVRGNSISVQDLGSSNGVFVNGAMATNRILSPGDTIALYDVLLTVVPAVQQIHPHQHQHHWGHSASSAAPSLAPSPQSYQTAPAPVPAGSPAALAAPRNLTETLQHYVENVAMPGIYHLVEIFEYRHVLAAFVGAFILIVTLLSAGPMIQITKSGIEKESRRRALTIARNLALINQPAIQQGMESTITTQVAEREEGVDAALIVNTSDGSVIAPQKKAGSYVADMKFIHTARKNNNEMIQQIDSALIGASVPIRSFNPELGSYSVIAHAVVIYNMDALAFDTGRIVSLFTQTLLIAAFFGAILWFFLYRLSMHPLRTLNAKLDQALKENHDHLENILKIPEMDSLSLNISSALSRAANASPGAPVLRGDRGIEAQNLVQLSPLPAMAVDGQDAILFVNAAFEELVGIRLASLQYQPLETLGDQALKLNLQDLISKNRNQPGLIATGRLDFGGRDYEIDTQAISGASGVEYFLIYLRPEGGES